MASDAAIEAWLEGMDEGGAALLRQFRTAALHAGGSVEEKLSKTMIAWRRKRAFASAYVQGRYLECSIDLLRAVEHPHLKAAFHTTKKVVTNRFTLEKGEKVDARMKTWLKEAWRDVGPGTR